MTLIEIGHVTRPHGIRGEVRVHLHWLESDTLGQVDAVTLVRRGKPLGEKRIVSARRAHRAMLLRLEGVLDRDAAEALRGCAVSVPRGALPALEDGEYYLFELVGARVVGPAGVVGEVVEVRVHPSVDAVVVRTPDGRVMEQPLSPPWVVRVDALAKVIELASTDGLI